MNEMLDRWSVCPSPSCFCVYSLNGRACYKRCDNSVYFHWILWYNHLQNSIRRISVGYWIFVLCEGFVIFSLAIQSTRMFSPTFNPFKTTTNVDYTVQHHPVVYSRFNAILSPNIEYCLSVQSILDVNCVFYLFSIQ